MLRLHWVENTASDLKFSSARAGGLTALFETFPSYLSYDHLGLGCTFDLGYVLLVKVFL
jgi:hypothetical protein